jgi:hypothetical protein
MVLMMMMMMVIMQVGASTHRLPSAEWIGPEWASQANSSQ